MRSHLLAIAAGVLLVGCTSASLTKAGAARSPKPKTCEFEILTALPENHVEVGTVDVKPGEYGPWYRDLGEFKEFIRPQVCEAGGEAAVALANGNGIYVKATVLVRDKAAASTTPTAAPSTTSSGGCNYDTQCKGDRLCREGECVDP